MQIIYYIIICILVLNSCEKSSTNLNNDSNRVQLEYSMEDSSEAYDLALWFDEKLLPSDSTFKNCLFRLNYLRYTYGDSIPVLYQNRFMTPWVIGQLLIGFDNVTASKVTNNQYDGWDQLETDIRPDTILKYPDRLGIALIGFNEDYNPVFLSEIYSGLPGVRYAEPNIYFLVSGTYPIFPGRDDGGMSFLFVEGYQYSAIKYYYFKYVKDELIFVGVKNRRDEIEPGWWLDALNNIQNFYSWNGL